MRGVLVVAVALLAGCLSDPAGGGDDGPGNAEAATAEPQGPPTVKVLDASGAVLRETFHVAGRMGTEVASYLQGPTDSEGWQLDFSVAAGVQAIVIEVAWNDTLQDLDALASSPYGCFERVPFPDNTAVCVVDFAVADGGYGSWWNKAGSIGLGDSPSRIIIEGPDLTAGGLGRWQAYTWSKDANSDLDFHIFATALYDGSDPATFTAIPWA